MRRSVVWGMGICAFLAGIYWMLEYAMQNKGSNRNSLHAEKTGEGRNLSQERAVYEITDDITRPGNPHLNSSFTCKGLIEGREEDQIAAAKFMRTQQRVSVNESFYMSLTCSDIRQRGGYITNVSVEEELFPLAFSILMFKDTEQVERLLRVIYRPHNHYCIHVDEKAGLHIKTAMAHIASCLPGIFLSSRFIDIHWGTFTILEAELMCMKALLMKRKWRYFINLTGQEYPLKTNLQLVRILKLYNGANDVHGLMAGSHYDDTNNQRWKKAGPLPDGWKPVKGNLHVAVNRQFVYWALYNSQAKVFTEWLRKTHIPDETFFSSLNYNTKMKIPGAYNGSNNYEVLNNARYVIWYDKTQCSGKFIRSVCIFGVGDLPRLTSRPELFLNKLHLNFEPLTMDCLEQWYFQQVAEESKGETPTLNMTYYRSLPFIKDHFPLWNTTEDIGMDEAIANI